MPIRQRYPRLPKAVEYAHIGWDLLILAAVIINLSLLLFDSLFLIGPINQAIAAIAPGFHRFYDTAIDSRFIAIDLVFVSFFIADVLLGLDRGNCRAGLSPLVLLPLCALVRRTRLHSAQRVPLAARVSRYSAPAPFASAALD